MAHRQTIEYTNEQEWLDLRKQDVTSTEMSMLWGMSPYGSKFELWMRKTGKLADDFQANERVFWGTKLEAAIAAGVAEKQQWNVRPKKHYMRIPDARIGSSFDYEILDASGQPCALLEIKNVGLDAWHRGWIEHAEDDIEAPLHIEVQIQHQMMVSGIQRGYIAALVGGNEMKLIERQADPSVHAKMIELACDFWQSVDAGVAPDPVYPGDAKAVIELYSSAVESIECAADSELDSLVKRYLSQKAIATDAERAAESLKAQIFERIGEAGRIVGEDYTAATTRTKDSPGTLVTEAMVGQYIGARSGYRQLRFSARKKPV